MKPRERLLRAIGKKEVDRIPFWVKIFTPSYLAFQPKKYSDMSEIELSEYLELDHLAYAGSPVVKENENFTFEIEEKNDEVIHRYKTKDGILQNVYKFDPESHSYHPVEYLIKDRNDLKIAFNIYTRSKFRVDEEKKREIEKKIAEVGDKGIVRISFGTTPLMVLLQKFIGIENTYYFLTDFKDEMEQLMELMHRENLEILKLILSNTSVDGVICVENTSTTLLSPQIFKKYCYPCLKEYGELIKNTDKFYELHMCGKLKNLLSIIDTLPADCIEAFSSPPVGDTTIKDGFDLCPSKAIIGGTCATIWLYDVESIILWIEEEIRKAGKIEGLVLTSAGVMPPAADIEKIKKVREQFKSFSLPGVAN